MSLKPKIVSSVLPLVLGLVAMNCADSEFKAAAPAKSAQSDDAAPSRPGSPVATVEQDLPGIVSDRPDSLLSTFPASVVKDESMQFSLTPQSVSMDFKLSDIASPLEEQVAQNTRTAVSKSFKQGSLPTDVSEMIDPKTKKGPIDILVVVDDSGSMSQEQQNLSSKMNDLLVSIQNNDWQIGVITTSPKADSSCAMTLIKSNEADAASKFATAVQAGTNGDGNEQGIRQAVVGLSCSNNWVRPAATWAVLILSDEDNCGNGQGCGNNPWNSPQYLIDYVEKTKNRTVGKNTGFYGIFAPEGESCPTRGSVGRQYMSLVTYNAGGAKNWGNICDASYSTTLNRISASIATLVENQIELKDQPAANTLSLKASLNGVETAINAGDYTLSGKTVTFAPGKEPALNAKVIASYKVGLSTLTSEFDLGENPAAGTVKVKVNGAALAAGNYSIAGSKVTFVAQPAPLADIMIDFRQDMPLINKFKLAQTPAANTLSVKVNGAATNNYIYDAAKNEVTFPNPPSDGAAVTFNYTYRQGPQLSYAVPIGSGASDLVVLDGNTVINYSYQNGILTIPAEIHKLDKSLRVQYQLADSGPKSFPLGHTPLENSVAVNVLAGSCDLGTGLEVQGNTLFSSCVIADKLDFNLSYKYLIASRNFTIDGISNPEKGRWQVFIDGDLTTDYTREGSTIQLAFDPDLASKVTIHYTFPE